MCQLLNGFPLTGRRQLPSKEVIEQDARETKERLLALSQPTQDKGSHAMQLRLQPLSLLMLIS